MRCCGVRRGAWGLKQDFCHNASHGWAYGDRWMGNGKVGSNARINPPCSILSCGFLSRGSKPLEFSYVLQSFDPCSLQLVKKGYSAERKGSSLLLFQDSRLYYYPSRVARILVLVKTKEENRPASGLSWFSNPVVPRVISYVSPFFEFLQNNYSCNVTSQSNTQR